MANVGNKFWAYETMRYTYFSTLKFGTYLLFDDFGNYWLGKYNGMILEIKEGTYPFPDDVKLSKHHIVPKSIAPELENSKENFVYLPIPDHMMLHYYLWKFDPAFGRQLWFGCVWCRKNGIWDLPSGNEEYEELKKSLKKKI